MCKNRARLVGAVPELSAFMRREVRALFPFAIPTGTDTFFPRRQGVTFFPHRHCYSLSPPALLRAFSNRHVSFVAHPHCYVMPPPALLPSFPSNLLDCLQHGHRCQGGPASV